MSDENGGSETGSEDFVESGIQCLRTKVDSMTTELINDLLSKWKVMYVVDETFVNKSFSRYVNYVEEFHSDILESAEKQQEMLVKQVEEKLQESQKLQKELKMEIKTKYNSNEPLTVIMESLEKSMKEYREIRAERVKLYQSLQAQEAELCELLTETVTPCDEEVPSEEQLRDIQLRILSLQKEKRVRQNLFTHSKSRIIDMMNKLEVEPHISFENEVLKEDAETFKLSKSNMEKLKRWEATLEKEIEDSLTRVAHLKSKLEKLWGRINVEMEYREGFLSNHKGIGKTDMKAVNEELERCEEIKLANIKPMVLSVRQEMFNLWDKLTYSGEQRLDFQPYYIDVFTEDVLDLHELECTRLHEFYEENKKIFELADKREVLWQRMLHLDQVAQDKSRLFNNRGGQLLKEEKERKMLEINLPKIDSQLSHHLLAFMEKNGKPFLWYGENLMDKITTSWQDRLAAKQAKVLSRKNGQTESVQSTGQKRKFPASTPKGVYLAKIPKKTPSSQNPPFQASATPNDLSNASIASYSTFQENIDSCCPKTTPRKENGKRGVLKENATPLRAHSSPTTPKSMRRVMYTPIHTPKSTPRRNPPESYSAKKRIL